MEKSLVVQGKSLEDALNKAAVLLHCARESVAYEILQEPKGGRYGQRGIPCKLRVIPVAAADSDIAAEKEQEDAYPDIALPWSGEELGALPAEIFLQTLGEAIGTVTQETPRRPAGLEQEIGAAEMMPREVCGDVSLHTTGDIRHEGLVRVYGNVHKGMSITAAGGIHVVGDVETAFLQAGGDIIISGGLLGTARSALGNVACKFAQGARIAAPCGDILVRESAMHAHLHAGRRVEVGEILLGGICYGETMIEVRIAGSPSGVPATLIAGPNRRLHEESEAIRERAVCLIGKLAACDSIRRALLPVEVRGEPLPADDRVRLWQAVLRRARLNRDLLHLSRQKAAVLGMINQDRNARIRITDRAYPKVKIIVDDLALELQNMTQYVTFSKDYDAGSLRMTPYA